MSRLTGNEAKSLMEAYNAVYASKEEVVEEDIEVLDEQGGTGGVRAAEARRRQQQAAQAQSSKQALQQGKTLGVAGNFGLQTGTTVKMDSDATRQQGRTVVRATDSPNISNPLNKIQLGGQTLYRAKLGGKDVYVGAKPQAAQQTTPVKPVATTPVKPAATAPAATAPAVAPKPAATAPATAPKVAPAPAPKPSITSSLDDLKKMQQASQIRQQAGAPTVTSDMLGSKSSIAPTTPRPQLSARAQALRAGGPAGGARERMLNQSFDMFDAILEHLVAEGYADTNKAAIAIMANMSEEWRQSIVEGIGGPIGRALKAYSNATAPLFSGLPKSKTVIPGKYGTNTVLAKKDGVEGVSDKTKPGSFTQQKGGWDRMDAERYGKERIKQGAESGGVNLSNRRETPNRVK